MSSVRAITKGWSCTSNWHGLDARLSHARLAPDRVQQLDGIVRSARIVPPTSQNQRAIEDDLRRFVQARLDFDDTSLTSACEQAIRNYDPCISCSTHFLDLRIDRR